MPQTKRRSAPQNPSRTPPQKPKKDIILILLKRKNGASVAELMNATGWQAHSVRGFLSGTVKKKLKLPLHAEGSGLKQRRYFVKGAGK